MRDLLPRTISHIGARVRYVKSRISATWSMRTAPILLGLLLGAGCGLDITDFTGEGSGTLEVSVHPPDSPITARIEGPVERRSPLSRNSACGSTEWTNLCVVFGNVPAGDYVVSVAESSTDFVIGQDSVLVRVRDGQTASTQLTAAILGGRFGVGDSLVGPFQYRSAGYEVTPVPGELLDIMLTYSVDTRWYTPGQGVNRPPSVSFYASDGSGYQPLDPTAEIVVQGHNDFETTTRLLWERLRPGAGAPYRIIVSGGILAIQAEPSGRGRLHVSPLTKSYTISDTLSTIVDTVYVRNVGQGEASWWAQASDSVTSGYRVIQPPEGSEDARVQLQPSQGTLAAGEAVPVVIRMKPGFGHGAIGCFGCGADYSFGIHFGLVGSGTWQVVERFVLLDG